MRPTTVLRTLIAAAIAAALAGSVGAATLEPGVRAGLNVSDFRGYLSEAGGFEPRTGFVGGGYLAIWFGGAFALQPEVLYSQKGGNSVSDARDATSQLLGEYMTHWNLEYLEIPVLARVRLGSAGGIDPFLIAGPSLGINLSATMEVSGWLGQFGGDIPQIAEVDPGGVLGGGLSIPAGSVRVLFDARYTAALGDLFDVDGNEVSMNSTFSFSAGVAF